MRSTQMGVVFKGKYNQLPSSNTLRVVWEVSVGEEMPACIKPLKPKLYLLGKVLVKANEAVCLA